LSRVLAHEFGHMLRLTAAEHAHSDDRGVQLPWRHDIWSRMRLMSKYVNYQLVAGGGFPDRLWHDTTYGFFVGGNLDGTLKAGDLIAVKNFSNDGTDGDITRARRSARNPYAH